MTEVREVNPDNDFQKTAAAQTRKIEAIKDRPVGSSGDEPLYINDEMFGRCVVSSRTEAEYKRNRGGHVHTEINSGKANLAQTWGFDHNGKLNSFRIQRKFDGRNVGMVSFKRDVMSGKFQIEESKSSSGPMSPTLEKTWEEEFFTARMKMGNNQHTPDRSSIKPLIEVKSPLPQT